MRGGFFAGLMIGVSLVGISCSPATSDNSARLSPTGDADVGGGARAGGTAAGGAGNGGGVATGGARAGTGGAGDGGTGAASSTGGGGTGAVGSSSDAAVSVDRDAEAGDDSSADPSNDCFSILVMLDISGSMSDVAGDTTRFDAVRTAVTGWWQAPQSSGLEVGLSYFGHMPIGQTSCDPADYAEAAVAIASLPGNALQLTGSLDGVQPTGETPTGAAIRGACQYGRTHTRANPARRVATVLITDGLPRAPVSSESGCAPTLEDAIQAAVECASDATPISTYVIGLGDGLAELDAIAAAGETGAGQFAASDNRAAAQLSEALNAIRDLATSCREQN
jgi:Mg-chelatase subunit ChlD